MRDVKIQRLISKQLKPEYLTSINKNDNKMAISESDSNAKRPLPQKVHTIIFDD